MNVEFQGAAASDRILPARMADALCGPMGGFVDHCSNAPLLCVAIGSASSRLGLGLQGLSPAEPAGADPLGFHTCAASTFPPPAPQRFQVELERLRRALEGNYHFVIPLAMRSTNPITERRITLGRSRDNDIVLRDGTASKLHACFELDADGGLLVVDAGSKNGTALDGVPVPAHTPTPVSAGAMITFGCISTFVCEPYALWQAVRSHDA